jgi:outer membrane protein assembly factor BamB
MFGAGLLSTALWTSTSARAGDWPRWGRDNTNNMASQDEKGLAVDFSPGEFIGVTDDIDAATMRNIKWVAKLGSQTYGNPTIADGRVYVGTNNDKPRDPRLQGDRSCVYCFDEETGDFLWELSVPKLGAGKVSDWEFLGICSSPTVDGDRVYVVTNLSEVVCLDVAGLKNGNQGYQDEAKYIAGKGKEPVPVKETDADILWLFDMIGECGSFPHNVTSSSVLIQGDHVWASTSNGVDYGHVDMPAPGAPCLILLDKNTGELVGEEGSGIGSRTFHCNWSSPGYLKSDSLELGIFAAGDGYTYGFSPNPVKDEDGYGILQEVWRFDCNVPSYRSKDGKPVAYATREGPSELIASPVVYKNRVYALIGQDPEHGEGVGNLVCIDPTKKGDITETGKVWEFSEVHRSISTPSIADDLVYVADYSGFVFCVDANTGDKVWKFDTMGHIWGSTLVADDKVYIGNEDGYLTILKAGRKMERLAEVDMMAPVYSSPVAANGVLYVATQTHLFAIQEQAKPAAGGP